MTIAERNNMLKHFIICLKCRVRGENCVVDCPTQYDAGNMGEIIENLEAISKALEQGPTTKNDLGVDSISREQAKAAIRDKFKDLPSRVEINTILNELPSVNTQEPKTGHWIVQPSNVEQGERSFIWWKCSNCGQVIFSETSHDRLEFHAFCGRCGSRND